MLQLSAGVRYMLVAVLLFAALNVLVKYLSHIPAVEIVFFRALVTLVVSYAALQKQKVSVWGNNRKVLFLRGAFGTFALILLFITFQEMRLATATTVHYLAPVFTALIAAVVLKERLSMGQIACFGISFVGVLLIRGFDSQIDPYYLGVGVVSAFFAGAAYNCIRYLKTSEHPLVIVFYFPLVAMPVAGAISYFGWVMPVGWDWFWLLMIGLCTQGAQVLLTKAYQNTPAAVVAGVTYSGIVYALIFGLFFFQETYTLASYLGIGVVMLGVLLNVLFFGRQKKKVSPK